ncbi:MAG TPA: hypothetical protein VFI73_06340 [Candidatus Nitrosopolaris sp.]|nr:hypothetical protein [Candidatus Nitrosopolaris sp.]
MKNKIAVIGILTVVAILSAPFPSAMTQQSVVQYTNDRDEAIILVTWYFI